MNIPALLQSISQHYGYTYQEVAIVWNYYQDLIDVFAEKYYDETVDVSTYLNEYHPLLLEFDYETGIINHTDGIRIRFYLDDESAITFVVGMAIYGNFFDILNSIDVYLMERGLRGNLV